MNPPDPRPAGDPESVRTGRRPAPEQRPAPPEEIAPRRPAPAEPSSAEPSPQESARQECAPGQSSPQESVPGGLTERESRILAFERQWWKHAGAKEQAIRDTFGLSATRYYQLLNNLLDNPAALAAEPQLVGRLRRLRATRARNRRR